MAQLDGTDYTWIKQWVKGQPSVYRDLAAWGLTKATYHAGIQAVEDYMVNAFANTPAGSLRSTVEGVTGATTSQRAQTIIAIWAAWKTQDWLGG
jgi:hypothetical protein